jgi:hypothetical protein
VRETARRAVASGVVIGVIAAVGTAASMGSSACTGHDCEGSYQEVKNAGEMISPDTWESSTINGPWLEFPGGRADVFDIGHFDDPNDAGSRFTPYFPEGCIPTNVSAYISADYRQMPGTNFTEGSGNVIEWVPQFFADGTVNRETIGLVNNTCAHYYVRVVVQCVYGPPLIANSDAGDAESEAPPAEASSDAAPADATSDSAD